MVCMYQMYMYVVPLYCKSQTFRGATIRMQNFCVQHTNDPLPRYGQY